MAELPCRQAAAQGRRLLFILALVALVIDTAGEMGLQDRQGALWSGTA